MSPMNRFSELALAMDPALVIEQAGMMPDPWQRDVLRQRPKQLLLNCSRQSGKSTTVGAMALDEAVFAPDPGLVLILSPSLRQSREAFRVIMHMLRNLEMDIEPEAESSLSAEFASGSRIVALPGKEESIRGFSKVKLLIVDEAARVADDLYRSVRPMLAVSGGRIAVLSTPFGKRGFFFKEWTEGENWNRVRITAEQCPRIAPEFLAQERSSLPLSWYRQEYFCEFAEAEGSAFSYDDIMRALSDEVRPLFPAESDALSDDVAPIFGSVP